MSERPNLETAAAGKVEVALQDATAAVSEAMFELQVKHGFTNSEIRAALVKADFGSPDSRFRSVGFASAWDDYEPEEAPGGEPS